MGLKYKNTKLFVFLLGLVFLFCFIGPFFSPYSHSQTNIENALQEPSFSNFLGTDGAGRDVLTRLMYGGRVSLLIGLAVVFAEILIGTVLGILSGYYGKIFDKIIMGITDVFMCVPILPSVLVVGAIMADLNAGVLTRIMIMGLVIALMGWPYTARLIRSQVLLLKHEDYMIACVGLGLPTRKKMMHIFANILPQVSVSATISAATAILTESALSFLGLGVVAPYPSWGNMIQSVGDRGTMFINLWVWMPAGFMIFFVIFLVNSIGDSISS
jgi:peptide/nickel transport system permease protein